MTLSSPEKPGSRQRRIGGPIGPGVGGGSAPADARLRPVLATAGRAPLLSPRARTSFRGRHPPPTGVTRLHTLPCRWLAALASRLRARQAPRHPRRLSPRPAPRSLWTVTRPWTKGTSRAKSVELTANAWGDAACPLCPPPLGQPLRGQAQTASKPGIAAPPGARRSGCPHCPQARRRPLNFSTEEKRPRGIPRAGSQRRGALGFLAMKRREGSFSRAWRPMPGGPERAFLAAKREGSVTGTTVSVFGSGKEGIDRSGLT